ncbi:MAG: 50S ribosomal protein L5 [Methanobacteriota archaeon]
MAKHVELEAIELPEFTYENPMREPIIEKVIVNIGVGEAGDKLMKAEKVLGMITGAKPARTQAKVAVRDWAVRKGMPIGCRVTLRDEAAAAFLKRAFWIRNNQVPEYSFDETGNLNFGIADYTDFQGMKYDPEIGIFGMNVTVVLGRRGARRLRNRRIRAHRIPGTHRLSREEGMAFLAKTFELKVI